MKEKLKKKLDLNLKSEKIINKTLYNIKEILDLTIYDTLESDDYIEVMEHKFKKTICLFSVFIYSLKILNSKKTISIYLFIYLIKWIYNFR